LFGASGSIRNNDDLAFIRGISSAAKDSSFCVTKPSAFVTAVMM
jgi:hypothetical protein